MFTEAYLEPSQTSTMELFLFPLSHIVKMYLIPSNYLYSTHPFAKKLTTENFGRKSLFLIIEHFFPKIQNYEMGWCHHKK